MNTLVLNHLWQSTLFAGLVALLALLLRKHPARVRFWLWMAASLKFLVPFALLAVLGSHLAVAPETTGIRSPVALSALAQPFTPAHSVSGISDPTASVATASGTQAPIPWRICLLALWLCGFTVVIARWLKRWSRIAEVARKACPAVGALAGLPVRVLFTDSSTEPGAFGIFRSDLLLPASIARCLSPAQLQLVIAHEICHIRRRDNLWAALHALVQAAFWFHPFVWWIGARLVAERERACDEAVLSQGGDPESYAESILQVCRYFTFSPIPCVSGVAGGGLRQRIAAIMAYRIGRDLSRTVRFGLAALLLVAIVGPLAAGFIGLGQSVPPAQSAPGVATAQFDVVSIKPFARGTGRKGGPPAPTSAPMTLPTPCGGPSLLNIDPGHFSDRRTTVLGLIALAYGKNCRALSSEKLLKGPPWIRENGYMIDATIPNGVPVYTRQQLDRSEAPVLQQMLQRLLADRFGLVLRRTVADGPVYLLTRTSGAFKAQPADMAHCTKDIPMPTLPQPRPPISALPPCYSSGQFMHEGSPLMYSELHGFTLDNLAADLSGNLERPVKNETGIAGTFNILFTTDLGWPPALGPDGTWPVARLNDALRKQLGLQLKVGRGPVERLIVERVNLPSAN